MSNPTNNGMLCVFFFLPFLLGVWRQELVWNSDKFMTLTYAILFLVAECTPQEAFSIVGDNVVFASGSPFKDVDLGTCLEIVFFVSLHPACCFIF